ncbi:unnamed protein product, partial [Rhizoctonia solani]
MQPRGGRNHDPRSISNLRGDPACLGATTTLRVASPTSKSNMCDNLRRVVETAELLTLITDEFDICERRKLMLVSKHFFRCIGPGVWKSVPRLDFLMELIEGTEVKSYRYEDSQGAHYEFTEITIVLPLNPDLSRYNIYAPWVQELEIFGE